MVQIGLGLKFDVNMQSFLMKHWNNKEKHVGHMWTNIIGDGWLWHTWNFILFCRIFEKLSALYAENFRSAIKIVKYN